MDDDLRQLLITLYERLRIQQETLFDFSVSTAAMRKTLRNYEHFEETYARHFADEVKGPLAQKNSAELFLIDAVISRLKGLGRSSPEN